MVHDVAEKLCGFLGIIAGRVGFLIVEINTSAFAGPGKYGLAKSQCAQ